VTSTEVLPAWGAVVIELNALVGVVASGSSSRRRVVGRLSRRRRCQRYCENTLSEVVVESVSMVRLMSICSISVLAALVVISKLNGSPAV